MLETEQPLTFFKPDFARFGALRLAYEALRAGGSYPIAYNGANEAAVEAFCDGRIGFSGHRAGGGLYFYIGTRPEMRTRLRQSRKRTGRSAKSRTNESAALRWKGRRSFVNRVIYFSGACAAVHTGHGS
jgi:hypothetical protein